MWLLTHAPSGKAEEIRLTPDVAISFQKDPSLYVVLSGTARLVKDPQRAKQFWKEAYRPWFPEGPEDRGLALIRVNAERGEYWDNTGAKRVSYAYEFVRSYVTGETPRVQEGEQHGRVQLS